MPASSLSHVTITTFVVAVGRCLNSNVMVTDNNTLDDTEIPFTDEWWETQRVLCGVNARQLRFARLRFENPTAKQAEIGKQAGIEGTDAYLRVESSRLARNPRVQGLLEVAAVARAGIDQTELKSAEHYLRLIASIVEKSHDQSLRLRAASTLVDLKAKYTADDREQTDVRVLLRTIEVLLGTEQAIIAGKRLGFSAEDTEHTLHTRRT